MPSNQLARGGGAHGMTKRTHGSSADQYSQTLGDTQELSEQYQCPYEDEDEAE